MIVKTPIIGTPFPISDVRVDEPSFNRDIVKAYVNKGNSMEGGHGTGISVKESLYTALGEYLERLTQSKPSHKLKEPYLSGYNLTKGATEKIPLEDILLFDFSILKPDINYNYVDSTGTAFHTNSVDLIEGSFFEFIERQSLVFNWLTKTPGTQIILDQFFSFDRIKKISDSLTGYLDNLYLFDISIHPTCHVVISIGSSDYCKAVGMGVGWDLEKAIFSSLRECWQSVSHKIPSHQSHIRPAILKQLESVDPPEIEHIYLKNFEEISSKQLIEKYNYLFGDEVITEIEVKKNRPSHQENLTVLKNISEDLSIELLICYIPSILDDLPGSVIKIIGKGAFPHIKADELNPHLYTINGINKLNDNEIPNRGVMVPFA
ncbi:YcaO-like family protein [Virgibacillus salarius]|nr:YcaO-like family protein [Priestia megaterium]